MIEYNYKDKKGKETKGTAATLDEFKSFIHEHKKEISKITTSEINGKYWQFDLRGGWKELDHDPEDLPF